MTLDYFKDHLFDLINESDLLDIQDILCFEEENRMEVILTDGSIFSVSVKQRPDTSRSISSNIR